MGADARETRTEAQAEEVGKDCEVGTTPWVRTACSWTRSVMALKL